MKSYNPAERLINSSIRTNCYHEWYTAPHTGQGDEESESRSGRESGSERERVGVIVRVNVRVGVGERVRVGERVGERVRVGVRVGVNVRVRVNVRVGKRVRVNVRVGVREIVGVRVGVGVNARVGEREW